MKFTKPFFVLGLAAFAFSPALADQGKDVSYSLKKQGRVHFQDKTPDQASNAAQEQYDAVSPDQLEPAAGVSEVEEKVNEPSLSDKIRLPRKN